VALFGLRQLRPGFAKSTELDRAFALGFPERLSAPPSDGGARLRAKLVAAEVRTNGDRIDRDVVLAFARRIIPFGWAGTFDDVERDVFELEALAGGEVVCDAMIAALEEISEVEWKRAGTNETPFYLLGLVMLRVEEDAAVAFRARVEALWTKRSEERSPLTAAVDLLLHGGAGARRSARRHGPTDEYIDPMFMLLVDDDPALVATVVRAERFSRWDRRFAARLAFLGGADVLPAITSRWSAIGDAAARASFARTVGEIAGADLDVASFPAPPPRTSKEIIAGKADEFGYVFLPKDAAEKLNGEEDHTELTKDADPTSLVPVATELRGTKAVLFCRTYDFTLAPLEKGDALITYGTGDDPADAIAVFDAASTRRWEKLTTLEGALVGAPANMTYEEGKEQDLVFEVPLPPGRYEVRAALMNPESSDEDELLPLLWLTRIDV
jgi:hypothetical protein